MSEPNYKNMSEAELRKNLLKNPTDTQLFHAYVDKVNQEHPDRKPMSVEEAIAEMERKVNQNR